MGSNCVSTKTKVIPSEVRWDVEYRQVSNISHTFVGNKIIDHLHVAPVGAAPTTSSFST